MVVNIIFEQFTSIPLLQYLTAFAANFCALNSGLHYGWSSPSIPKLLSNTSDIHFSPEEASWIATTLLFGTVIGSLLSGLVLDVFGRKAAILISSVPFFIAWILIAFANTLYLLLLGRFLAGIADGLIQCSVPIYIGEIANAKVRGLFGSAISVFWFTGMLLSNITGSYSSIKSTALILSSAPVLMFLIFIWMPDSPYYLIKKGELDKSEKCLKMLTGKENVTAEVERIQDAVTKQATNGNIFNDLVNSASDRKAFFLVLIIRTFQQTCGVIPIMFYAQIIIGKSSDNTFSPETGSIIYFSMYALFLTVCSTLVDKVGRKPLLMLSLTGSGLALLIQSLFLALEVRVLPWIPVVTIIAYAVFFSLGMQSISILLQGELLPVNIKAKASSIYVAYVAIIGAIIFKIFQISSNSLGLYVPLFLFAVSCFIGILFVIFCLPETKGKTLEEIQEELKVKKEKCNSDSRITNHRNTNLKV